MFCASTFSTLPEASRPGDALRVGGENGQVAVPPGGEFAPLHLVDLSGEFGVCGPIRREEFRPFAPGVRAARADPVREVFVDSVRHKELRVFGPSVVALG